MRRVGVAGIVALALWIAISGSALLGVDWSRSAAGAQEQLGATPSAAVGLRPWLSGGEPGAAGQAEPESFSGLDFNGLEAPRVPWDVSLGADASSAESIEVFFVGGPERDAPGSWTTADERFTRLASAATRTIDVAAYGLSRDSVVDALLDAYERGVSVRVVMDNDAASDIGGAGFPIVTDTRGAPHHNKFAVFDGAITWTGSANFTRRGFSGNSENLVVITSEEVADAYTTQFNEMFVDGRFGWDKTRSDLAPIEVGDAVVDVAFGPTDGIRAQLLDTIQSADDSLLVAMNIFTDQALADALIARHRAGATVVVELDDASANLVYSVRPMLCAAGIRVLEESFDGTLHDKFAVIDAGTVSDPLVITGSTNWSGGGMVVNDENSIVVHSNAVARQYRDRFEDLASDVHPGIGCPGRATAWLPLASR